MGGSSSVAQVDHNRQSILLALHSHLKDAGEPISTLALAAFRRADRSSGGWIASASLDAVLHELGLADRWDRLHVDAFAGCFLQNDNEWELGGPRTSSRLDYLAFLDIVFFPIQVSCDCVQLKITQPAIVSAGGWRVHDGEYAGRTVAIKEVELCEPGNTNEAVVQLRRRVNALRLAAHPNLLRYVTTVQTKQSLYIVQQAHASCTLMTILQSFGPMKETTIRRYLVQIVDALSYLHSHDIVHGYVS
jgi:serine/threonine protein kinase